MRIDRSDSKREVLLLAILALVLNLGLLLLPSVLLGLPYLVLTDRRLAVFIVIVSLWIILEAKASSNQIYVTNHHSSARWLPSLMSASILFVFLASLTEQAASGSMVFTIPSIIGLVLMILGVILRYFAIRRLGCYFLDELVIVAGQPLITNGIYSRLRHPSEMGNLCIAYGSSLLLGSFIGFIISTLVVVPIVLVRIRLEDRLLMRHYPKLFGNYARTVPTLFPWQMLRRG